MKRGEPLLKNKYITECRELAEGKTQLFHLFRAVMVKTIVTEPPLDAQPPAAPAPALSPTVLPQKGCEPNTALQVK